VVSAKSRISEKGRGRTPSEARHNFGELRNQLSVAEPCHESAAGLSETKEYRLLPPKRSLTIVLHLKKFADSCAATLSTM